MVRATVQVDRADRTGKVWCELAASGCVSPIAAPLLKLFCRAELSDLLNAEQTASQATEAEALARAKTVRSSSCLHVL